MANSKNPPLVHLQDVEFRYDAHPILERVNLLVDEGEYLGIIGPNGSGKTTLLKIMLGLFKPSHGKVELLGEPIDQLKDRSQIGYVPQRITQADFTFPATVEEVVRSGRTAKVGLLNFFTADDAKAIDKAMQLAGIKKFRHRLIGQLSGGERQRVFIARALASEPKLLILDEPTVGVDAGAQEDFYTLLCELNSKHNLTIILVSHDIDVIAQEVKTILFLNRKVVGYGSPRELMKEKYLEKLYGSQVKFIVHQH